VSDWAQSAATADPGSPLTDFSTLKTKVIRFSEILVNPGSKKRHIPEDDIFHEDMYLSAGILLLLQIAVNAECMR
jgi:hypothetical protein